MRIVFMGTPDFSVPILTALAARHDIVAVYSQPPRPAGRGKAERKSPVQLCAEELGLPVRHPVSLRTAAAAEDFAELHCDVAVVVAYGLILPPAILQAPKFGCLNIHASLLPRWRGAAPIHRAILAGDAQTGVCIMQMDEGLDTGAMLCHEAEIIRADDTTASLHDRLAAMGGRLIVDVLRRLEQGTLPATAQPQSGVCYADKIRKDEAALDFRLPAAVLFRRIRAFNPFPGALAQVGGVALKIWRAELTQHHGQPGEIVAAGPGELIVACGEGALRLVELQKPSGKRLPAAEFLKGFPLQKGQRFEVHS